MLQKYCARQEKVAPRHTKSCNCYAKWSLQSNTSVTWNLQPFHGFSVGGFKHRHHKARNPCACHAKRMVPDPPQIHHACQRFCNPHELLRLPRILQRVKISPSVIIRWLQSWKKIGLIRWVLGPFMVLSGLFSWGPTVCSQKSPRWPTGSFMIVFLVVDPGPIRFEPAPNQCSMIFFLGHVLWRWPGEPPRQLSCLILWPFQMSQTTGDKKWIQFFPVCQL